MTLKWEFCRPCRLDQKKSKEISTSYTVLLWTNDSTESVRTAWVGVRVSLLDGCISTGEDGNMEMYSFGALFFLTIVNLIKFF